MPYEVIEWEGLNLTAISSTEQIMIYSIQNPIKSLYSINRVDFGNDFIRSESLCHCDWGYGITPNISREKSRCLLAIGWDKVLQIAILDYPERGASGFTFDGYYV